MNAKKLYDGNMTVFLILSFRATSLLF